MEICQNNIKTRGSPDDLICWNILYFTTFYFLEFHLDFWEVVWPENDTSNTCHKQDNFPLTAAVKVNKPGSQSKRIYDNNFSFVTPWEDGDWRLEIGFIHFFSLHFSEYLNTGKSFVAVHWRDRRPVLCMLKIDDFHITNFRRCKKSVWCTTSAAVIIDDAFPIGSSNDFNFQNVAFLSILKVLWSRH